MWLDTVLLAYPPSRDVLDVRQQIHFFTDDDGRSMISDTASIASPPRSQAFRPFYRWSRSTSSVDHIVSNSIIFEDGTEDDETFHDADTTTSHHSLLVHDTVSNISSQPVIRPDKVLHLALDGLCRTIDDHHSLQSARILSTSVYVEPNTRMAPHRCIVMHIEREGGRGIWLRLDRRPSSRIVLLTRFGSTRAIDQVGGPCSLTCWRN